MAYLVDFCLGCVSPRLLLLVSHILASRFSLLVIALILHAEFMIWLFQLGSVWDLRVV